VALERRVIVPLIVACALFMQNLDQTALATALTSIAADLHETPLRLHLTITSFMLSLAAFLPLSGWVADKFGARTVFRGAIAIFTLASIACGLTSDFEMLLLARVVQGAGGALMVPVGRLILLRSVKKSELISAMALMGMPALIGPIIGPLLAGILISVASWRWIFWINVPIGILGIILVTIFIEDVRETDVKPFDWPGFVLSSLGLCGTLFGLDMLSTHHSADPIALTSLVVGVVSLALYIVHARRAEHPILDLKLMKLATFRVSVTGGSVFRVGVGAVPFLLPLMMQQGFGYTPFESGLITFVSAAGSFGMRTMANRVLRRFGFRQVLIYNALIAGALMAMCGLFTQESTRLFMMVVIFLGGLFRSLQFTALNTVAFAEVEHADMSQATSFSQMIQRLSLSSGVAFSAFILFMVGGENPQMPVEAFATAFVIVGLISALSFLSFFQLAEDAGAEIAGRQPIRSRRFDRD
jgi:EmrB/QacA subfamily drug resistance transporter